MERSGNGRHLERLTQFLAESRSRRRLVDVLAPALVAVGWGAGADARKRKRRKKKKKKGNGNAGGTCQPACADGYSCDAGVCTCRSNVICDERCCAAGEACLEAGCCADDQVCNGACCPEQNRCIRNACCFETRVCNGDCCENDEVCANIAPGNVKGCCDSPMTIRGEICCPTGSLQTRLNCGSYQCSAALSGTGPGGCDMWCKVGFEGTFCGPDIEGFPVPGEPNRACCCTEIAPELICVYPFPDA